MRAFYKMHLGWDLSVILCLPCPDLLFSVPLTLPGCFSFREFESGQIPFCCLDETCVVDAAV